MGPQPELAIIERFMRDRGMRWTNQRMLITEVALHTHAHFSADELLAMCQERDAGVSRATVYRTLSMLESAGFVEGLDTGEGRRLFEHVLGHCHHDHMVCTTCGKIIEFRDQELEKRQEHAARSKDFEIHSHSLKLFGLCRACRTHKKSRRPSGRP